MVKKTDFTGQDTGIDDELMGLLRINRMFWVISKVKTLVRKDLTHKRGSVTTTGKEDDTKGSRTYTYRETEVWYYGELR